jgi:hypothetical protein
MSEHAAAILLDKLMSDADGISALHLARTGLREDRWGREYADAIGQEHVPAIAFAGRVAAGAGPGQEPSARALDAAHSGITSASAHFTQ